MSLGRSGQKKWVSTAETRSKVFAVNGSWETERRRRPPYGRSRLRRHWFGRDGYAVAGMIDAVDLALRCSYAQFVDGSTSTAADVEDDELWRRARLACGVRLQHLGVPSSFLSSSAELNIWSQITNDPIPEQVMLPVLDWPTW